MFNPCDAILCFYLLLGERYLVNAEVDFHKSPEWYSNKILITNDNIFDDVELYKLIDDRIE